MARVYISIGSNIERDNNIRAAIADLRAHYGRDSLLISSVYESEAVGFAGDNFYNLVVGLDTDEGVEQVSRQLRLIEDRHGRTRTGPRFSARTLDLDLLTYDDLILKEGGFDIPREEITKNAFVLWPLAEIAAQERHPELGQSYAELWAAYDKSHQQLWVIPLALDAE